MNLKFNHLNSFFCIHLLFPILLTSWHCGTFHISLWKLLQLHVSTSSFAHFPILVGVFSTWKVANSSHFTLSHYLACAIYPSYYHVYESGSVKSVTCSTTHLSYRLYASLKDPTVWYSRQKMHFSRFWIFYFGLNCKPSISM